jgi:hypothetical protein
MPARRRDPGVLPEGGPRLRRLAAVRRREGGWSHRGEEGRKTLTGIETQSEKYSAGLPEPLFSPSRSSDSSVSHFFLRPSMIVLEISELDQAPRREPDVLQLA